MSSSSNTAQWFSIIFLALVSVVIGVSLGFASQALLPVKTYAALPSEAQLKKSPLPKVYWLKAFSSKEAGNYRQKEKSVLEAQPVQWTDREIAGWMGRIFGGAEVKEDIDAKLGTPYIRIGGQGRDDARDPMLVVTMPFNLKVGPLPVSEVPLQFTATPNYENGRTEWQISHVRLGHARVPESMSQRFVEEAVAAVVASKPEAKTMWERLLKYRRVTIRDSKLVLESPVK